MDCVLAEMSCLFAGQANVMPQRECRERILTEPEQATLTKIMGSTFVDALPYLADTFAQLRRTFAGGSTPDFASTRKEIVASLKHVATVADRGEREAVDLAIADAAPVVSGWYLPWHVSRLIGGPDLQGFDPALLAKATTQEIATAARSAILDGKLREMSKRGRQKDVSGIRLIRTMRQAFESHTGRQATADARGSKFLDALSLVAKHVGWTITANTLRARAYAILQESEPSADQREGPLMWITKAKA